MVVNAIVRGVLEGNWEGAGTSVTLCCGLAITLMCSHRTHQKNLNSTKDVHGSSKSGTQIETQSYSSSELWAQRPRDHVIGSASYDVKTETEKIVFLSICIVKYLNKWSRSFTVARSVC